MKVLIDGITGQDGFYLAQYLLNRGCDITGVVRRTSLPTNARLENLKPAGALKIVDGDVTDLASLTQILGDLQPDHYYHLAAASHVGQSWKCPVANSQITGLGTLNALEAVRIASPKTRFYFAGSSEQFGNTLDNGGALNEQSPMSPESPYAVSKVFGYHMTGVYRRSYGLHASAGILFNHESFARGEEFVSRKITMSLARIKHRVQDKVRLGNVDSKRDWGHARDYVRAMVLMLEQDIPDDYVIATGSTHSVWDFLTEACKFFDLDPHKVLEIDPALIRPKDVNVLLGDPHKARKKLGWAPEITFEELVREMCLFDLYHCHPDPAQRAKAVEALEGVTINGC